MITLKNVSKWYGQFQVLKDGSTEGKPGEMVALLGASGSGKSTLLRHLAGFVAGDADSGTIHVNGELIQRSGRMSRSIRRSRAGIGFVFQQFNLVGRLPVIVNVLTGLLPCVPMWRSLLRWFIQREVAQGIEALRHVGIEEHAFQRASTLSGGQQQRAAIARTLVQNARVVLADEPIASLDPESSRRVMDTLAQINCARNVTVVVSLHQVDTALRYCPRVVALRQGKIVYDGPSSHLTPAMLQDLYGSELDQLRSEAASQAKIPANDEMPFDNTVSSPLAAAMDAAAFR
jgi:phosphonate transport system ATP-binding protein